MCRINFGKVWKLTQLAGPLVCAGGRDGLLLFVLVFLHVFTIGRNQTGGPRKLLALKAGVLDWG